MSEITVQPHVAGVLEKEKARLEASPHFTFRSDAPHEIQSLIVQGGNITTKLDETQKLLESKQTSIACPICQEGELNVTAHGKIFGVIPDKWLICNKCNAEFDKKLNKAVLIKATKDPYSVYKKYANQTLSIKKWNEIGLTKIKKEISDYEEDLSRIKSKLEDFTLQQFLKGTIKLILADISGFMLRQDEVALFATVAEVIEERKRRLRAYP